MHNLIQRKESTRKAKSAKASSPDSNVAVHSKASLGRTAYEEFHGLQSPEEMVTHRIQRMLRGEGDSDMKSPEEKTDQPALLRQVEEKTPEETSESVQLSPDGTGASSVSAGTESKIESMRRSGGAPLDRSTREFMESRMGHDFSDVRVHTGGDAEQTATDLSAKAYTVGKDIAFNKGEYQPETAKGKKLLAHELTHTVQQGGSKALRQKPVIQRQPDPNFNFRVEGAAMQRAMRVNRARHDYNFWLVWKMLRITGAIGLYRKALEDAESQDYHKDRSIRENFVKLVEYTQYKLGLPQTGILDRATGRRGEIRFQQIQRQSAEYAADALAIHLVRRHSATHRGKIIQILNKAADRLYIKQLLPLLEAKASQFGQNRQQFIMWMYSELKEFREDFASIIMRHGGNKRIARIRAAQLMASDDSDRNLGLLTSLTGRQLTAFLTILETAAREKNAILAQYVFLIKLKGAFRREKLREKYFKEAEKARLLSVQYTGFRVWELLKPDVRDESDISILMYFYTTPIPDRKRVIEFLTQFTVNHSGMTGPQRIAAKMLPDHYERLRRYDGVLLTLPARELSGRQKAAMYLDRFRILTTMVIVGPTYFMTAAIPKAIAILVGDIALGVKDLAQLGRDLGMMAVYKFTDGKYGSESMFRLKQIMSGIEAFAENPKEHFNLLVNEVWNDVKINGKARLMSGAGSARRLAVWMGDMAAELVVNVALVALTIAWGLGAAVRFVSKVAWGIALIRSGKTLKYIRKMRRRHSERFARRVSSRVDLLIRHGVDGKKAAKLAKLLGDGRFVQMMDDIGAPMIKRFLNAMGDDGPKTLKKFADFLDNATLRRFILNSNEERIRILFTKLKPRQMARIVEKVGVGSIVLPFVIGLSRQVSVVSPKRLMTLLDKLAPGDFSKILRFVRPEDISSKMDAIGMPALERLVESTRNGRQLGAIMQNLDAAVIRVLADPETGLTGPEIHGLMTRITNERLRNMVQGLTGAEVRQLERSIGFRRARFFASHLTGAQIRDLVAVAGTHGLSLGVLRNDYFPTIPDVLVYRRFLDTMGDTGTAFRLIVMHRNFGMPARAFRRLMDVAARARSTPGGVENFMRHVRMAEGGNTRWERAVEHADIFRTHHRGRRPYHNPYARSISSERLLSHVYTGIDGNPILAVFRNNMDHFRTGHTFADFAFDANNIQRNPWSTLWDVNTDPSEVARVVLPRLGLYVQRIVNGVNQDYKRNRRSGPTHDIPDYGDHAVGLQYRYRKNRFKFLFGRRIRPIEIELWWLYPEASNVQVGVQIHYQVLHGIKHLLGK